MFTTLVRRAAERSRSQLDFPNLPNPYRLKKVWPPNFSKLSPQEQLRFEKRYKRRVQLAAARPRWNKMVKLAQFFSITFVIGYSVLFMDWKNENQPFDGVRDQFWGVFGSERPGKKGTPDPSTVSK